MNTLEHFAHRLTCLFETGEQRLVLDSLENLGDGRGFTCGWAGFTTADEEVVACVESFARRVPNTPLAELLPLLRFLRDEGSDDVSELTRRGFRVAWRSASTHPAFAEAYAEVVDRLFGAPARAWCARLRFADGPLEAIAFAILFDSLVQHGNDLDPDSVPAMIERTSHDSLDSHWLRAFLGTRRQTLLHPHNRDTADVWRDSVSRVQTLEQLLLRNAPLRPPLCFAWEGGHFTWN